MPAVNSLVPVVHRCGVVQLNGCLKLQEEDSPTAKSFSQVAGERCHMLTQNGPDSPSRRAQPWLEAFSLRAGSRAEERGLAIDWFSSLALACIPRFRRPGSSHWLRGHAGHSSIFLKTSSMSCSPCLSLFLLRTHYYYFSFHIKAVNKCVNIYSQCGNSRILWHCDIKHQIALILILLHQMTYIYIMSVLSAINVKRLLRKLIS